MIQLVSFSHFKKLSNHFIQITKMILKINLNFRNQTPFLFRNNSTTATTQQQQQQQQQLSNMLQQQKKTSWVSFLKLN